MEKFDNRCDMARFRRFDSNMNKRLLDVPKTCIREFMCGCTFSSELRNLNCIDGVFGDAHAVILCSQTILYSFSRQLLSHLCVHLNCWSEPHSSVNCYQPGHGTSACLTLSSGYWSHITCIRSTTAKCPGFQQKVHLSDI